MDAKPGRSRRLIQAFDAIKLHIQQRMLAAGTPGLALALFDHDGIGYSGYFGSASLFKETPVTQSTLFGIGSVGKLFTAVAALLMEANGQLDLRAPVTETLPWFTFPSSYPPITLHHLLTHTSGLPRGSEFSPDPYAEVWNVRNLAASYPPGAHYHYSDLGYKLAGLVLEAAGKQWYPGIIRQLILTPLRMNDSQPAITADIRENMAQGLQPVGGGGLSLEEGEPPDLEPAPFIATGSGDGSQATTASDMARFGMMLLNQGAPLLSLDQYQQLTTPHIEKPEGGFYGYGIDLNESEGVRLIGHGGDMPGYEAYLRINVSDGLGMALLSTTPYPSGLSGEVMRLFRLGFLDQPPALETIIAPDEDAQPIEQEPVTSVPDEWMALVGHYRAYNPWYPGFRVVANKGSLWLQYSYGAVEPLTQIGEYVFRVGSEDWTPERLSFDWFASGQPLRAQLSGGMYYRFFLP